jgi:hypothetical protein
MFALSRLTHAGGQPPHYLSVRIANERESLHRLLSEGLGLLFGLPLILRQRHPFPDDFSPRLVFGLHAHNPSLKRWVRHRASATAASGQFFLPYGPPPCCDSGLLISLLRLPSQLDRSPTSTGLEDWPAVSPLLNSRFDPIRSYPEYGHADPQTPAVQFSAQIKAPRRCGAMSAIVSNPTRT